MIIIMQYQAKSDDIDQVVKRVEKLGFKTHLSRGEERTIIGLIGNERPLQIENLELMPGVERVVRVLHPFKVASRDFQPENTINKIGSVSIGGPEIVIMAGPCAVESREQILETAHAVKEAGAKVLRGGAFKPRTSPYVFQGLGEEGLELLAEAREQTGLKVVTEVMNPEQVEVVGKYADILQIGTRNMQNFSLLHAAGESQKPVLLKRGMMATIEEWLMAAEYILSHGNMNVTLCERGIRTYETSTRNTLDINAIPVVKQLSHLPIIVDPSHSTGKWEYVTDVARAAIAAGADGLIVEVHPNPVDALSDGAQSLKPAKFAQMVKEVGLIAQAVGRKL